MLLDVYQRHVETTHNERLIIKEIEELIIDCVDECVPIVLEYFDQEHHKAVKARHDEFRDVLDILIKKTLTKIALFGHTELLTILGSVNLGCPIATGKTVAEVIGCLSDTGLFDVYQDSETAIWYISSNVVVPEELAERASKMHYMPPMVVPPNILSKNYDSDLLTVKSSMILGKGNHHDNEICLDALNKFNQIPLTLNQELLTSFNDRPKDDWLPETVQQWQDFYKQSYGVYKDIIQTGNTFYQRHKYDKRGRMYVQGYHVNSQGNSFRKAMVELAEPEVVTV